MKAKVSQRTFNPIGGPMDSRQSAPQSSTAARLGQPQT